MGTSGFCTQLDRGGYEGFLKAWLMVMMHCFQVCQGFGAGDSSRWATRLHGASGIMHSSRKRIKKSCEPASTTNDHDVHVLAARATSLLATYVSTLACTQGGIMV